MGKIKKINALCLSNTLFSSLFDWFAVWPVKKWGKKCSTGQRLVCTESNFLQNPYFSCKIILSIMICTLCYIQYAVSMSMKENTLNKRWHSRNWKRGYCIVDTKFICTTNCGFETGNFRIIIDHSNLNNKKIYVWRQNTSSDIFGPPSADLYYFK